MMPRKNKGDGPIMVLSDCCWVKSVCYVFSPVATHGLCHVLDAEPKEGISYSWRSIIQGLELIKQGYIWRIGDGTNVKIWTDPWIPRAWSRRVITPKGANLMTHVNELMCPITGGWDERL